MKNIKAQGGEMTIKIALSLLTVSQQSYQWQDAVTIAFFQCNLSLSKHLLLHQLFLE